MRWCDSSPCKNGGTCWQQGASYTCQCQTGWTGLYCDIPSVSCEVAAKQQGMIISQDLLHIISQHHLSLHLLNLQVPRVVCTLCNSVLDDFRCGGESPVQKLRSVSGCWKHTLLPLPGWLHWELLPGASRWVLTQSLSEWSHLYWLSGRLQLWGRIYWNEKINSK